MREVTDAAQVNVSAISYHFSGKEGLYQAVLENQLAPLGEAMLVQEKLSLSPSERLAFYAEQLEHIHSQRPFLARFMNSESINPTDYGGPIIEKHLAQVYHFMHTALQEGIARGDFRADLNVNFAAVSLAGILNFYFIAKPLIQRFNTVSNNSNIKYAAHAFRIYLHGISK